MNAGEKSKDFKSAIKRLFKELKGFKILITVAIILAILSAVLSIVAPDQLSNLTDEISAGLRGNMNMENIKHITLLLLGLYIGSAIFNYIQSVCMTDVANKFAKRLRSRISIKINKLPMRYFDKKTKGEVLSIVTNDIDTLSQNLNQSITQIITAICTLIGILIMMLSISYELTLISILILPITIFVVKNIVGKSQKYFKSGQDYLGHVNGQVEEVYGAQTIVKAFNGEEKVVEEFNKANKELYHSAWKSQFLSGLIHPLMNFIGNIGYVAVAIMGGYLAIEGKITVGNIQSFIQYNKQFTRAN